MKPSLRFSVFKRGNFTCAYCGRRPPEVVLEVDHIQPLSKGGTDEPTNLICSCRDCNRGKGKHRLLDGVPDKVLEQAAEARERLKQLQSMQRAERAILQNVNNRIDALDRYWHAEVWGSEYGWTDASRNSVKRFMAHLGDEEIKEAMQVARRKFATYSDDAWRYLCGICWTWIRDGGKAAHDRKAYGSRGNYGK